MEPTDELVAELDEAKIRQARAMSEEQRFLSALELFDMAAEMTKAGIRADHPHANDEQVMEIFRDRLLQARHLEALE